MTLWHRGCSYARNGRRRKISCAGKADVTPNDRRIRCFVESPLDAALVLLEERRAELALTLLHS
jgi:hypothetical protein